MPAEQEEGNSELSRTLAKVHRLRLQMAEQSGEGQSMSGTDANTPTSLHQRSRRSNGGNDATAEGRRTEGYNDNQQVSVA